MPAGAHTKGSINVRVAPIQLTDNPILQKFHIGRTERPDLHLPAAPRHPRDVRLQLHDQVGEGEDGLLAHRLAGVLAVLYQHLPHKTSKFQRKNGTNK